uniref:Uncharacterized protein n=1 Tax=Rhizophora mucronata TaxID=61149 RepID=A0A2P2NNL2_RHIMU
MLPSRGSARSAWSDPVLRLHNPTII